MLQLEGQDKLSTPAAPPETFIWDQRVSGGHATPEPGPVLIPIETYSHERDGTQYYIGTPIRTPLMTADALPSRIGVKTVVPKRVSRDFYERLYREASLRTARQEAREREFRQQKEIEETHELDAIRERLHHSAGQCRDTRSRELRDADLLKKRQEWIRLGHQRRREEADKELQECTFHPKLTSRKRLPNTACIPVRRRSGRYGVSLGASLVHPILGNRTGSSPSGVS